MTVSLAWSTWIEETTPHRKCGVLQDHVFMEERLRRRHGDEWMHCEGSQAAGRAIVAVPSDGDSPRQPGQLRIDETVSQTRNCSLSWHLRLRSQAILPFNAILKTDHCRRIQCVPAVDQASLLYLSLTRCCAAQAFRTIGPRGTTIEPFCSSPASWRSRGTAVTAPGLPFIDANLTLLSLQ
jgi:hypothetical protein